MLEEDPSSNAAPSPDAVLPPLTADQLKALREVGSEWGEPSNGSGGSLPIDPSLGRQPELSHPSRGSRLVHVAPASGAADDLEATVDERDTDPGPRTVGRRIRRAVLRPPLKSTAVVQERMRRLVALPVLSADALSSVAYGPEAMLAVLILAGGSGLGWSLPISGAIAFLMLAVGRDRALPALRRFWPLDRPADANAAIWPAPPTAPMVISTCSLPWLTYTDHRSECVRLHLRVRTLTRLLRRTSIRARASEAR